MEAFSVSSAFGGVWLRESDAPRRSRCDWPCGAQITGETAMGASKSVPKGRQKFSIP
jgi:hypothetical protein